MRKHGERAREMIDRSDWLRLVGAGADWVSRHGGGGGEGRRSRRKATKTSTCNSQHLCCVYFVSIGVWICISLLVFLPLNFGGAYGQMRNGGFTVASSRGVSLQCSLYLYGFLLFGYLSLASGTREARENMFVPFLAFEYEICTFNHFKLNFHNFKIGYFIVHVWSHINIKNLNEIS